MALGWPRICFISWTQRLPTNQHECQPTVETVYACLDKGLTDGVNLERKLTEHFDTYFHDNMQR